jgi:hypothetical protein
VACQLSLLFESAKRHRNIMHQRKPSVLGGRSSKFTSIQGKRWDKRNTHENLKVGQGHKLNALLKTNGSLFAIPYETNGGVVAFHGVEE